MVRTLDLLASTPTTHSPAWHVAPAVWVGAGCWSLAFGGETQGKGKGLRLLQTDRLRRLRCFKEDAVRRGLCPHRVARCPCCGGGERGGHEEGARPPEELLSLRVCSQETGHHLQKLRGAGTGNCLCQGAYEQDRGLTLLSWGSSSSAATNRLESRHMYAFWGARTGGHTCTTHIKGIMAGTHGGKRLQASQVKAAARIQTRWQIRTWARPLSQKQLN